MYMCIIHTYTIILPWFPLVPFMPGSPTGPLNPLSPIRYTSTAHGKKILAGEEICEFSKL